MGLANLAAGLISGTLNFLCDLATDPTREDELRQEPNAWELYHRERAENGKLQRALAAELERSEIIQVDRERIRSERDRWRIRCEAFSREVAAERADLRQKGATRTAIAVIDVDKALSLANAVETLTAFVHEAIDVALEANKTPCPGDVWRGTLRHIHQEERILIKAVEGGAFQTTFGTIIDADDFSNGTFEFVRRGPVPRWVF